jgi:hypothetical protein
MARAIASVIAVGTTGAVIISLLVWIARGVEPLPVSYGRSAIGIGGLVVAPIAYVAMGSILAGRLSRNPIGWLFLAAGVALGTMLPVNLLVASAHEALRPAPPEVIAIAWARNTFGTPIVLTVIILAGALFPTGRPIGRRWWAGVWVALGGGVLLAAAAAADPAGLVSYPSLSNPTSIPEDLAWTVSQARVVAIVLLVAGGAAAVGSLAVRYRGGDVVVRAQLRWVTLAAALALLATVPFVVSRYLVPVGESAGEHLAAAAQLGASAFPVATAIAISRYRLFDIDVVVGRTLVYLPLTAILGGLYTAAIAFFQRLFIAFTGESSDAAIVLTALVVAAAFTPVRRGLEGVVERRFGRPGAALDPGASASSDAVVEGDSARLAPAVLVAVAADGTVACPLRRARGIRDCLACEYLRAIVRHPSAAIVCSPPIGSQPGVAATPAP